MVSGGRCLGVAGGMVCRCRNGFAFHGRTGVARCYRPGRVRGAQPLASRCVDESPLPVYNLAMGQVRWLASGYRLCVEAHGRAVK